jgi:hypothetical protein
LFALVLERGGFKMGRHVRFCPYCGGSSDNEVEAVEAHTSEQI